LGKAIRGFKQGLTEIDVDAKDIKDDHQQVSHQNQQNGQAQNQTQSQKEKQNS
jgi:sec-independent protein translocase protein TatA